MGFSHLALLLVVAALAGIAAKLARQPLIVGYLFAGFFLHFFGFLENIHLYEGLGQIGVALLLFLVGLEVKFSEIRSIGKIAFITGLAQIAVTSLVGFGVAKLFAFGTLPALYIAVGLTFSSTIIIVKLLSERNELNTLHGRISLGFLLVQDVVAIVILIALAGLRGGDASIGSYLFLILKAVVLIVVLWLLAAKIMHRLYTKILDNSSELVFIFTIAWALGLAAFVGGPLGLSLEIGGFLAGLTLSNLPENVQIASRTKPIRDFFLTIFFIILGTNLAIENFAELITPAIVFSLFVIIGNPLIMMILMGILGYKKKTSLATSLTVAQVSEFSLILLALGFSLGHVSENDVALVILVSVITMTISTYMIMNTSLIYKKLKNYLNIFERKMTLDEGELFRQEELKDHIVLVGAERTGMQILKTLKKKNNYVVIEYNPEIVEKLIREKTSVVFGDAADQEVGKAINLQRAKLIISTTPNKEDNLAILDSLVHISPKPKVIMNAITKEDALTLYKNGATYVIVPEVLAGEHIRHILRNYGTSLRLAKAGKSHYRRLQLPNAKKNE